MLERSFNVSQELFSLEYGREKQGCRVDREI
jgi:hypothetical protein